MYLTGTNLQGMKNHLSPHSESSRFFSGMGFEMSQINDWYKKLEAVTTYIMDLALQL